MPITTATHPKHCTSALNLHQICITAKFLKKNKSTKISCATYTVNERVPIENIAK